MKLSQIHSGTNTTKKQRDVNPDTGETQEVFWKEQGGHPAVAAGEQHYLREWISLG